MTKPFKPMLAASCDDLNALVYPLLATPKIDGIRCLIIDGVAMSRSLKPIPNVFIQSIIGNALYNGLDGELLVGNSFQQATSGIMSSDGEPDFTFHVFDTFRPEHVGLDYYRRVLALNAYRDLNTKINVLRVLHIDNRSQLDTYMAEQLALGFEGTMVRSPDSPYKYGRATFKENYLTKLKPFEDAEAIVIGFEERMHNGNEAKTNALGRTERSSHKENLVPMGTLGALVCSNQEKWPGQTFNIGTGFDDATRAELWAARRVEVGTQEGTSKRAREVPYLIGRTVKFKYQAIGTVDKPRIPVFLGFRDGRDL